MTSKILTGRGAALRILRKSANMTLDDVASAAGVSTNYLSRAENGLVEPSAGWVDNLIVAIGDHILANDQDVA